jgi:hypothetical protein
VFADLSDPVLFPRLPESKIDRLAARGDRRVYEKDELLFDQGMRDAPFFVIERGTVDIIDRTRSSGSRGWTAARSSVTSPCSPASRRSRPA